jgi:hypothetical protein
MMKRLMVATAVGVLAGVAVGSGTARADLAMGVRPPASAVTRWIRFGGLKSRAPQLRQSEAGVTLSLTQNVAFQLHYERTALAPTMRRDHDDGILTRLRVSF